MKYLETYENKMIDLFKSSDRQVLSKIKNFLEEIVPYGFFYIKKDHQAYWIYLENDNNLLISLVKRNGEFVINFHPSIKTKIKKDGENIFEFLKYAFDSNIMSVYIKIDEIEKYLDKLTIENYEKFIRKSKASEFNL